jgi:hypothetical protein
VYDVLGNHVKTLSKGTVSAGSYSAAWDVKDSSEKPVSSGMYFCVLKANDNIAASTRITLIK